MVKFGKGIAMSWQFGVVWVVKGHGVCYEPVSGRAASLFKVMESIMHESKAIHNGIKDLCMLARAT